MQFFTSRSDFDNFAQKLNTMHAALRCTSEFEQNDTLPFLDVNVHRVDGRLLTSIFCKLTISGLYTHWQSFCPQNRKINLIKTLVHRACKICSTSKIASEIAYIKEVFKNNGYPEHIVSKAIKQKLASFSAEQRLGPKKCPVYLRLPYKGTVSSRFEQQIRVAVSKVFLSAQLRVVHVTKPILPSIHKDSLPTHSKSNVIYKYTCRCEAAYVGRTTRRLEDRIKEHVPASFLNACRRADSSLHIPSSTSAIAQHLGANKQCLDHYSPSQFEILCRARNALQLRTLEALFIRLLKPVLCKQKELLFKLQLLG